MMKYFYYTLIVFKNNACVYDRGIVKADSELFPLHSIMQKEAERNNIPIKKVHIDFWAEISEETFEAINESMNETKKNETEH